jgi:hypothetical protein
MFHSISKKVTFIVAAIVTMLLVLEPTTDLTVAVLSLPAKAVWAILGFVLSIVNWPMAVMIACGFAIGFIIKTRSVDWGQIKGLFNKEEA